MVENEEAREIVKEGIVSDVFPERHSARVTFEDKDDVVSAELPVLCLFALKNKAYALPDVGDSVVCIFATNDGTTGDGWILGSRDRDDATPKVSSIDKSRLDFEDGTYIEYDRKSHELNVKCVGEIKINGTKIFLN